MPLPVFLSMQAMDGHMGKQAQTGLSMRIQVVLVSVYL